MASKQTGCIESVHGLFMGSMQHSLFSWQGHGEGDNDDQRKRARLPEGIDIARVAFASRWVPPNIDHIVIGSGLSGLYTAALLSKLGRRVLVLEQHYVAGGCTHTFRDQGFEFDTGVHYVGQGKDLEAMINFAAGRDRAFKMAPCRGADGSRTYMELVMKDFSHKYRPGMEDFVKDLIEKFPDEESGIRRFFRECESAADAIPVVMAKHFMPSWLWSRTVSRVDSKYIKKTVTEVLDECGLVDPALRTMLSIETFDFGIKPEEAPFCMQATILLHYISEGCFFPEGGSDAFAQALIPPIIEAGGAVLVKAPVERIIVENGCAVGVEIAKKGIVRASKSIISAAGVEVTYRKLLKDQCLNEGLPLPQSLIETEHNDAGSGYHVYCFIGLDGSAEELQLPSHNIVYQPTAVGVGEATAEDTSLPAFLTSDEAANEVDLPCFMSFSSAKDSGFSKRCPGKSAAIVLAETRASYFKDAGPASERSFDYLILKERYKIAMLKAFTRQFPSLADKMVYADVGTPSSNEVYLRRASSYGLDHSASRFLDPTLQIEVSGVKGLFLTGQDMLTCGIVAQPIVAWATVAKIMGFASVSFWRMAMQAGWSMGQTEQPKENVDAAEE